MSGMGKLVVGNAAGCAVGVEVDDGDEITGVAEKVAIFGDWDVSGSGEVVIRPGNPVSGVKTVVDDH